MLEDLREILYDPPSEQGWDRLCTLLDDTPHDHPDTPVLLDYTATHIGTWPSRLRKAPENWTNTLVQLLKMGQPRSKFSRFIGLRKKRAPLPSPHWAWGIVRNIDARRQNLGPHELDNLSHCPFLNNIERLSLADDTIGPAGVLALAQCRHLTSLHALSLEDSNIGANGVRTLTQAPFIKKLSHLSLINNSTYESALRILLKAPMPEMSTLALDNFSLRSSGIKLLCNKLQAPKLTRLFLRSNRIDNEELAALLNAPFIAQLETLDLRDNVFGDSAVRLLAKAHLPRLRELALGSRISGESLEALAESPILGHLDHLCIQSERFVGATHGTRAVLALSNSPYLRSETKLVLWGLGVAIEGQRALEAKGQRILSSMNTKLSP